MERTARHELADDLGKRAAELTGTLEQVSELDDQAAYHVQEAMAHLEYAVDTISPERTVFDPE